MSLLLFLLTMGQGSDSTPPVDTTDYLTDNGVQVTDNGTPITIEA